MSKFKPNSWIRRILHLPVGALAALFSILTRLSESFERFFRSALGRTEKFGETVSRADTAFARSFRVLTLPFIWAWDRVLVPCGAAFRSNPVLSKIGLLANWIFYPLIASLVFVRTFLQTRSRQLIFWAVPFVIVIGGTIFLMWSLNPRANAVTQKYRDAIELAVAEGKFEQAQLYQQKLQTLGIRSDQREMLQIEDLVKTGKREEAIAMAEKLAPLDKPGFPEAHFWLARIYLEETAPEKAAASLAIAETHLGLLKDSIRSLPGSTSQLPPPVVMLAAMVDFRNNRIDAGMAQLRSVSQQYWPALIMELETNARLGNDEAAIANGLALSQAIKKNPEILDEVSPIFFPLWSSALAAARDRDEFKNAIYLWYSRFPENERAQVEWTKFQFVEIEALMARGSDADIARAARTLVQTTEKIDLKLQPLVSPWLLSHLPPEGKKASYLQMAIEAGQSPQASSVLLEILGTAATLRNEHALAVELLKRSTEKNPRNAVAWNNLAYIVSMHFSDNLELALISADKAIELQPENIEMLHTRGFIYLQLRRWEEAIEDLRTVLARNPQAENVHGGLSQAYQQINKPDLAAFHAGLAQ